MSSSLPMSRPLRIEYEGAWYHVMNRGTCKKNIYHCDKHRYLFIELLQEIQLRFGDDRMRKQFKDIEIYLYSQFKT